MCAGTKSLLWKKKKGGDGGSWFLIFPFPMKKILSRAAPALVAASRGLRDGKAEVEQHFHLVVCQKEGKCFNLGTSKSHNKSVKLISETLYLALIGSNGLFLSQK